jgi:hypothetical protein
VPSAPVFRVPPPPPVAPRPTTTTSRNHYDPDKSRDPEQPRYWLSTGDTQAIQRAPIPADQPAIDALVAAARDEVRRDVGAVFRLKHAVNGIFNTPSERRSPAQSALIAFYHEPSWFQDLVRIERSARAPRASRPTAAVATVSRPAIAPAYDASDDVWVAHYVGNPTFTIIGVTRTNDGTPDLHQLAGYRYLRPLLARPASRKEESRDQRVKQMEAIVPLFVSSLSTRPKGPCVPTAPSGAVLAMRSSRQRWMSMAWSSVASLTM